MFKAFESAPLTINFSEVYSALQTKVAEGQENPLTLINIAKLYEVQKYLARTNHMWDGFWQLANGKVWKSLPADVQAAISKNFAAAAIAQREDMAKLNISVEKELKDKGLQFNEVDPALFRAKLQKAGFFNEWKGKYGDEAWAILEKYTGKIA